MKYLDSVGREMAVRLRSNTTFRYHIGILLLLLSFGAAVAQDGYAPPPPVPMYETVPRKHVDVLEVGGSTHNIKNGGVARVELMGSPLDADCYRSVRSMHLYVKLDAYKGDVDYAIGRNVWSATVVGQLHAIYVDDSEVAVGPVVTLHTEYDNDSVPEVIYALPDVLLDVTEHPYYANPTGYTTVAPGMSRVKAFEFRIAGSGGYVHTGYNMQPSLRLTLHVDEELVYDMLTAPLDDFRLRTNVGGLVNLDEGCASYDARSLLLGGSTAVLAWENPLECPDAFYTHYEIDLLRLYNIDPLSASSHEVTATIDWRAARRYQVHGTQTSLSVPLTQGSGYYIWRIRPVYSTHDGWSNNPLNWGPWSYSPDDGDEIAITPCVNPYSDKGEVDGYRNIGCFYYQGADFERNFVHTTVTVADSGATTKFMDSRSYVNSMGQVVQSQALNRERSVVIGSGVVYDLHGLPSLSTLPAPLKLGEDIASSYGFAEDAVMTSSGRYTAASYDVPGSTLEAPEQMDDESPLGWYNSNKNIDLRIPGAGGYPFSRAQYAADGTVKNVIPPGDVYREGSTLDSRVATRMLGRASDQELWSVFGDESPNTQDVFKQVVTSPDNVTSVQYVTSSGQLIATAQIGNGELDGSITYDKGKPRIDADGSRTLLNTKGRKGADSVEHRELVNAIESVHKVTGGVRYGSDSVVGATMFTVSTPTDVDIDLRAVYAVGASVTLTNADNEACNTVCIPCQKTIRISVIRLDANPMQVIYTTLVERPELGCSTAVATQSPANVTTLEDLDPGTYLVVRSSVVNPVTDGVTALEAAMTSYIDMADADEGYRQMMTALFGSGDAETQLATYGVARSMVEDKEKKYHYDVPTMEPCLEIELPAINYCYDCPSPTDLENSAYDMGFEKYRRDRELELYGTVDSTTFNNFFTTLSGGVLVPKYDFVGAATYKPFDAMIREMLKNEECDYSCKQLTLIWQSLVDLHLMNLHTPSLQPERRIDDIVEVFLSRAKRCGVTAGTLVDDYTITDTTDAKNAYTTLLYTDAGQFDDCSTMCTSGGITDWHCVASCLMVKTHLTENITNAVNATGPCQLPEYPASELDYADFIHCLESQLVTSCDQTCEQKRQSFYEKFSYDYPGTDPATLYCWSEIAVADCKAYCTPTTASDVEEYNKRMFGAPFVTAKVEGSCVTGVEKTSTRTVLQLLVQYLNDEYERRRTEAVVPICVNFAYIAREFLSEMVDPEDMPLCLAGLAGESAAATLADCDETEEDLPSADNPFLVRIIPGERTIPGYFSLGAGEEGCCDLSFTGPISIVGHPPTVPAILNAMLDTLWGFRLELARSSMSSTMTRVAPGEPYVDFHTREVGFDSLDVLMIDTTLYPVINNYMAQLYNASDELNGGTKFLPVFWSYNDPVPNPEDSSTAKAMVYDGVAYRTNDSSDLDSGVWRSYGPLGFSFYHDDLFSDDPPTKSYMQWKLSAHIEPGDTVLNDLELEYWHNGHKYTETIPLGDDLAEYQEFASTAFTDKIGRFDVSNTHDLVFNDLVTGETTRIPGLRIYRQHTRSLMVPEDECDNQVICAMPASCDVCLEWKMFDIDEVEDPYAPHYLSCEDFELNRIKQEVSKRYSQAVEAARAKLRSTYMERCLNLNHDDLVTASYGEKLYHYTLYYYDSKGRLVRTVSPKGVDIAPTRSRTAATSHQFISAFKVDSRGRVLAKTVTDGGTDRYIYDSRGRLRFTQDTVQLIAGTTSFIRYDRYGRVSSTGECAVADVDITDQVDIDDASLPDITGAGVVSDLVVYHYDVPLSISNAGLWSDIVAEHPDAAQRNLAGRLSWAEAIPSGGTASTTNAVRTVFSYTVNGATASTVSDIPVDDSPTADRLIKKTDYIYDASTGAVTRTEYQKGHATDQFFQAYAYDANGALAHASSSKDGMLWESDLTLGYDLIGNHRRSQLGEDRIQGMDYVYTIGGQLKSINHTALDSTNDPGGDGSFGGLNLLDMEIRTRVARDVFAMTYVYHGGDFERSYTSIGTVYSPFNSATVPTNDDLYGGLLGATASRTQELTGAITDFELDGELVGETYQYDLLGRLRNTTYHTRGGISGGTPLGTSWVERDAMTGKAYGSDFLYDPNNGVVAFNRNILDGTGGTDQVDEVRIGRVATSNTVQSVVDDAVVTGPDIDDQSSSDRAVDKKGRTTKDQIGGDDRTFTWNSFDALKTADNNGIHTDILYDAFGNVVRTTIDDGVDIRRIYDIDNGSVIYETLGEDEPDVKEWRIASGVSRDYSDAEMIGSSDYFKRHIGHKRYEVTDHLGSVRAIVPDMKLPVGDGSYTTEVYSLAEYDVYGMARQHRSGAIAGVSDPMYRYGFQGMRIAEGLTTESATGNDYTTPFRLYDSRLGQWLTHDPIMSAVSPYEGLGSNPISLVDPWGLREASPLQPGTGTGSGTGAGNGGSGAGGDAGTMGASASPDLGLDNTAVISGGVSFPNNFKAYALPYNGPQTAQTGRFSISAYRVPTNDFTTEDLKDQTASGAYGYFDVYPTEGGGAGFISYFHNLETGSMELGRATFIPFREEWVVELPVYNTRNERDVAKVQKMEAQWKQLDYIVLGTLGSGGLAGLGGLGAGTVAAAYGGGSFITGMTGLGLSARGYLSGLAGGGALGGAALQQEANVITGETQAAASEIQGAVEVVKRWGPMSGQGPLPSSVAETFRSATYNEVVTTQPTLLYRVWGGAAQEMGRFWATRMPSGSLQAQIDLALKPQWGNTASQISTQLVPAGTRLFMGPAASQGGGLLGGAMQVYFHF